MTGKGKVIKKAYYDEMSRSMEKVWSVLQNILDLFKDSTDVKTIYSDREIRLAMQKDLSPKAMTAVLYSHFDFTASTPGPTVKPTQFPLKVVRLT